MYLRAIDLSPRPEGIQERVFSLPCNDLSDRRLLLAVDAPDALPTVCSGQNTHTVHHFGRTISLCLPEPLQMNYDRESARARSPRSSSVYMAHGTEMHRGVCYGWLLQLLCAHQLANQKWLHWAYTSRHYHAGTNGYDGPTEYFFPLHGVCKLYRGDRGWQNLTEREVIAPRIIHQLRCADIAINLIIMADMRDRDGVRGIRHHHYCAY